MWEAIKRYSAAEKRFESIIWRACTQKHGVCSVGTPIQAENHRVFTCFFKLTPFEGQALNNHFQLLFLFQTNDVSV
jgi:hypothetical protein